MFLTQFHRIIIVDHHHRIYLAIADLLAKYKCYYVILKFSCSYCIFCFFWWMYFFIFRGSWWTDDQRVGTTTAEWYSSRMNCMYITRWCPEVLLRNVALSYEWAIQSAAAVRRFVLYRPWWIFSGTSATIRWCFQFYISAVLKKQLLMHQLL